MRRTCLHLTGFGPFMDVVDNPSARIAKELAKEDLPHSVHVVSVQELEVSMRGVDGYFAEEMRSLAEKEDEEKSNSAARATDRTAALQPDAAPTKGNSSENTSDTAGEHQTQETVLQHMFIHFGVHRGARGEIRLEVRGQNVANFPAGDMNGVVRDSAPIDASKPLGSCIESRFNQERLGEIAALVTTAAATADRDEDENRLKPRLAVTYDAGQYLCNYCLYRSTMNMTALNAIEEEKREAEGTRRQQWRQFVSLFIHVLDPERSETDAGGTTRLNPTIKTQVKVIGSLLRQLVELAC